MSVTLDIPPLNWFESNPWAKVGNKYTGSIGAVDITNNAFLFRINYYRKDEGAQLVAEVYDSLAELDKSVTEYTSETFEGTEEGRVNMIDWIKVCYEDFVSSGKNKMKVHYNK